MGGVPFTWPRAMRGTQPQTKYALTVFERLCQIGAPGVSESTAAYWVTQNAHTNTVVECHVQNQITGLYCLFKTSRMRDL